MKKLIYYITDHGKGHATRSVSIIRKLQEYDLDIIIRNSNAINFLQKSLPGIQIKEGLTDVGPILNSDEISINYNESISAAAERMTSKKIRKLAVTDNGMIVGLITSTDLVNQLAK